MYVKLISNIKLIRNLGHTRKHQDSRKLYFDTFNANTTQYSSFVVFTKVNLNEHIIIIKLFLFHYNIILYRQYF